MTLKLIYKAAAGEFEKAMAEISQPIEEAAMAAAHKIGDQVKQAARQDIAKAGFSKKWQNALRVTVYPTKGSSMRPAIFIYHKINYAGIFEEGGTISGNPLLWLPMTGRPKRIGRRRFTVKSAAQEFDLVSMGPSKRGTPMIGARAKVTKKAARTGQFKKVTLAALRAARTSGVLVRTVPLFVGVRSVTISDRLNIREIVERHADLFLDEYATQISRIKT